VTIEPKASRLPHMDHVIRQRKRQHTKFLHALQTLHTIYLDHSSCSLISVTTQRNANKPTNFRTINTDSGPKSLLKHVQHRPSAREREELLHKGEERVDRGASSSGRGQHVAVVGFGSNKGVREQGSELAALMAGAHRR